MFALGSTESALRMPHKLFKRGPILRDAMGKKERDEEALTDQIVEEIRRVKLPSDKEVLGVLEQRLGASRCKVRSPDGKPRTSRLPGRLKRRLWVRDNDIVLVEPWEFGGDEKGDILFKYK